MLDIKFICENPELVKENIKNVYGNVKARFNNNVKTNEIVVNETSMSNEIVNNRDSRINELIDMASKSYYVNITTNGYLIDRLKTDKIRQLNISIHSYDKKYGVELMDYMNNIFDVVDKLPNVYISYRLWVSNNNINEMINILENHYNTKINIYNST